MALLITQQRETTMITVSKRSFKKHIIHDDYPDSSFLEQEGFEERLDEYRRDEFSFVVIRASIEVAIPHGKNCNILHLFESPGLWGIESDSGEGYFAEVFAEESNILAEMLMELGVKVID